MPDGPWWKTPLASFHDVSVHDINIMELSALTLSAQHEVSILIMSVQDQ